MIIGMALIGHEQILAVWYRHCLSPLDCAMSFYDYHSFIN